MKTLTEMVENLRQTIKKSPWDFLDKKREVEEELEQELSNAINGGHDCHASPEDGCKGCDLILEAKRLTQNND